jgi:hypothetical protein
LGENFRREFNTHSVNHFRASGNHNGQAPAFLQSICGIRVKYCRNYDILAAICNWVALQKGASPLHLKWRVHVVAGARFIDVKLSTEKAVRKGIDSSSIDEHEAAEEALRM